MSDNELQSTGTGGHPQHTDWGACGEGFEETFSDLMRVEVPPSVVKGAVLGVVISAVAGAVLVAWNSKAIRNMMRRRP